MTTTQTLTHLAAFLDSRHLPEPFSVHVFGDHAHLRFEAPTDALADAVTEQVGGVWHDHRYDDGQRIVSCSVEGIEVAVVVPVRDLAGVGS